METKDGFSFRKRREAFLGGDWEECVYTGQPDVQTTIWLFLIGMLPHMVSKRL